MNERYDSVLETLLAEGGKRFSQPSKTDRKGYALAHGSEDLLAFASYLNKYYTTAKHHSLIAEQLQQLEKRKIRRLMISMPPRHGKSELVSKIFPLWYRGRNPRHDIIQASYSISLVKDFTGVQRDYIRTQEFADIFPGVQLKQDSASKVDFSVVHENSGRVETGGKTVGAGVGGAFTGKGAHLAIIDDPIKNFEEAASEVIRDNIDNWYQTTLLTRLEENGVLILVMTRWNTDDLAGRILKREGQIENGGLWKVLTLPAIDPSGNALWPEKYSLLALQEIKNAMSPSHWEALFQQNPVDEAEREFPRLSRVNLPDNVRPQPFMYFDPAFGGHDESALVGGVILEDENSKFNGHLFITFGKVWISKIEKTYEKCHRAYNEKNARILFYENNSAQSAIGPYLRDMGLRVDGITNTTDKHLRIVTNIRPVLPYLHFTDSVDDEFISRVELYHESAKKRDAPDALAGLIKAINYRGPTQNKNILKRYDSFFSKLGRFGL